jgi:hypothetical protein
MAIIATVSPAELIRSTWGNSVATELNTRCVKMDATTVITGSQIITGAPALKLRHPTNNPFVAFESTSGTRFSYIQSTTTDLIHWVDSAAGTHSFHVGGSSIRRLGVDSGGVDVIGGFTVSSGVAVFNSGAKFGGGGGGQIALIDTSTSGSDFHDCFISFYGAGTSIASPGTQTGFVGYNGTSALNVQNFVANGPVNVAAAGTGDVALTTVAGDVALSAGGTGTVRFSTAGTERGRIDGSRLLWGKTASNGAVAGVEVNTTGPVVSTTGVASTTNLLLRHISTASADGEAFIQFLNAAGTVLSEVQHDAVAPIGIKITACAVTAPSDYRLKDDLGPVVDPVGRLGQLAPKHLAWKENGAEFDGFIAHEVQAVVPNAVYGEKDGDDMQQLDMTPLIPLLTAAVQELADRLEVLEAG